MPIEPVSTLFTDKRYLTLIHNDRTILTYSSIPSSEASIPIHRIYGGTSVYMLRQYDLPTNSTITTWYISILSHSDIYLLSIDRVAIVWRDGTKYMVVFLGLNGTGIIQSPRMTVDTREFIEMMIPVSYSKIHVKDGKLLNVMASSIGRTLRLAEYDMLTGNTIITDIDGIGDTLLISYHPCVPDSILILRKVDNGNVFIHSMADDSPTKLNVRSSSSIVPLSRDTLIVDGIVCVLNGSNLVRHYDLNSPMIIEPLDQNSFFTIDINSDGSMIKLYKE